MVTFNQLMFSDDLTELYVSCSLGQSSTYNITEIYLEYYKNRNASGAPSSKALKIFEGSAKTVNLTGVNAVKATSLSVEANGVGQFEGGLFYVLVKSSHVDYTDPEYPVTTNVYDIGAVLDWKYLYEVGMQQVARFTEDGIIKSCEIPDFFEQFVLVWHAFELSLDAQDMDMMDRLWGRFLSLDMGGTNIPCNCR